MKLLDDEKLRKLVEAAIFVTDVPLTILRLKDGVLSHYKVSNKRIKEALTFLQESYKDKGVNLVRVASGYRFQAHESLAEDLGEMSKEKAPKYSRAIIETLALIAYKQPITRGEIEEIRGVGVSSYIMKTLTERLWVKVVGQKEVPGKPALYATTKEFLDYFGLNSLVELPELMPLPELSLENKESDRSTPNLETET